MASLDERKGIPCRSLRLFASPCARALRLRRGNFFSELLYWGYMKCRLSPLLAVFLTFWAVPATATDPAWVLSIPHAVSSEHIYKVQILEIDGQSRAEAIRYAVPPGRHTVKVSIMLRVDWDPEFAEAPRGPGVKELTLEFESGHTYMLAARFDADAPLEAQLDRSYWQPFVYRVLSD